MSSTSLVRVCGRFAEQVHESSRQLAAIRDLKPSLLPSVHWTCS